jgi:aquaporin Z
MNLKRKCAVESIGTAWLVLAGGGTALFSGTGNLGVALAFGFSLLGALFALGHVSGGHFNPAVTVGLTIARRFPRKNLPWYILSQLGGAVLASGLLVLIASGKSGLGNAAALIANGYGDHSPGGFGLVSALIAELVLTFFLVLVILGTTDARAIRGSAPLAIGLTLIAIHLVGIPITNLSVNPARSTGPAIFAGGWALAELWVFWLAPITGAALAGLSYRQLTRT